MDALILSCGTGGGHNAAGRAIQEELERRGHRAVFMNPYALRSQKTVELVDDLYISMTQRSPGTFGFVYRLGEFYRRLPWRSPVYFFNRKTGKALKTYLEEHPCDVIFLSHIYPAESLTYLRNKGVALPKTVFVATDYTCSPFVEEIAVDAMVTPHPLLTEAFTQWGIDPGLIHPLGIPVSAAFRSDLSKADARRALGLEPEETYLLVSAGSMGAGVLKKAVKTLHAQWAGRAKLIVICGSNQRLYQSLEKRYGPALTLLRHTDQMPLYLRACDLYFTKPGGLSSTEAAVAGVPLVHLAPIPGCETKNAQFFAQQGLSIPQDQTSEAERLAPETIRRQRQVIAPNAAAAICDLAEDLVARAQAVFSK